MVGLNRVRVRVLGLGLGSTLPLKGTFVNIASFRADILSLLSGRIMKEMYQIWA